ncbi:fungal-specific transcription factor domain-containing protein [Ilyonectria robusta]|uniref:fungal-specific transcription factor domain-containing protein n=1 Tax=Ilyonectria robusta TaxID=1079257 RepID=UPI001E8D3BB7|nr:fungal-specific transcription factor domain-containing protein [Ilyonectria robusta]KAH8663281.1 fungal-specific transcription factor domain-containing protein [Ilyonectria robusta]
MDLSNAGDDDRAVGEGDLGSCQGCRKRKLKCSRGVPVCSHCHRLGSSCVYDGKKNKPGLKPGAVEGLSRRIDALENAHLEKQRDGERLETSLNVLSNLSMQLCNLISKTGSLASMATPEQPVGHTNTHTASPASSVSWQNHEAPNSTGPSTMRPRKRRRLDSCGNPQLEIQLPLEDLTDAASNLPPPDLLEDVVGSYFTYIQPWIPILHETYFRARIHDTEQRPNLTVVLHAIVVAAIRFVQPEGQSFSSHDLESWAKKSRSIVLLTAMNGLSVENLQALIIIAYDDIGHGNASKAWSIIGSLTRTVEYLQLSIECEEHDTQPLLKPLLSLLPTRQWVEEEERRRVFWSIFNLDRFCSVTTGWNTSLTADDVHRRLPADGDLWHKEEAVTTPYFGIWDRSAAKIGNSIAFLPTGYSGSDHTTQSAMQHGSPQSTSHTAGAQPDMSGVGAFAYCIEATESLSRVTTFFLQQRINFHDRQEVSSWLTRFKELDLRLVHWKMFLPQRWKDSNISRQPTIITMDPNLTLAHATHNTSMILLHQRIAYPPADWTNIVELPSMCSAEICCNAAMEIQNIAAKYLKNTPSISPVGNQFAFCVFVAARVLLVHRRYYGSDLPRELWLLVESLDGMAKRWQGSTQPANGKGRSLAGIYADHLRELHRRCAADPNFSVDVLGYSTIISNQNAVPARGGLTQQSQQRQDGEVEQQTPRTSFNKSNTLLGTQSHPANDEATEAIPPDRVAPMGYSTSNGSPNDELSAISYMLLDQSFMDMDRVISLDDMLFSINTPPAAGSTMPVGMP